MYRKIIYLIISFIYSSYIFSQAINPAPAGPLSPRITTHDEDYSSHLIIVNPASGTAIQNKYPGIKGSPFFIDEWRYALIKLKDGRIYELVKILLDIHKQQLDFKTNDNVEMFFSSNQVKEIDIYNSLPNKNIKYKFKTGFPKIDNQTENNFYQVLSGDSVLLLKSVIKHISVNKNDLSGEVEKQFDTYEDYYVFSKNKIQRLKKEKDFIFKILADKKNKVEIYCSEKNINFKNINDIVSLLNYYNSLNS